MIGMFAGIFADSGPKVDIAPLPVFHVGGITITNSILYGWISLAVMTVLFIWVARRIAVKPKGGVIQYVEVAADFIISTIESAFDDKTKARKYVPYFITLFFFLLANNLLGLIPFVGDPVTAHGNPLLRPFTADFSATLAAAVVTMGVVYVSSIRELSFKKYLRHFFMGSPKNPLYLVLGLIEMMTDLTRVISLSIRLFLNISIVAIIVIVFAYLGHVLAPLTAAPFFLIDAFDDMLQAFIFVLLAVMYIATAVNHGSAHDEEDTSLTEESLAGTMDVQTKGAADG